MVELNDVRQEINVVFLVVELLEGELRNHAHVVVEDVLSQDLGVLLVSLIFCAGHVSDDVQELSEKLDG